MAAELPKLWLVPEFGPLAVPCKSDFAKSVTNKRKRKKKDPEGLRVRILTSDGGLNGCFVGMVSRGAKLFEEGATGACHTCATLFATQGGGNNGRPGYTKCCVDIEKGVTPVDATP